MTEAELAEQQNCPKHPGELVVNYCAHCELGVCSICAAIDHDGHSILNLSSLTTTKFRGIHHHVTQNENIQKQIEKLKEEVQPLEQMLHQYVDEEFRKLEKVLDEKRKLMHKDVTIRAEDMKQRIAEEIERCLSELHRLDEGQRILECLSNGEEVVPGQMGQIILGGISFPQFSTLVNQELHEPEKLVSLLGLQLPIQNLQDMCDLMTWTPLSIAAAPQIFPVSNSVGGQRL